MRRYLGFFLAALLLLGATAAQARRPHSIKLGKAMHVKLFLGPTNQNMTDMVVRPLLVDGDIREFTVGDPHDVTDETFVIQQAYRLNDALPDDPKEVAKWKWKWQKGTFLLVDRGSGRVTRLNLPLFDPFYSSAAWYQDYVAYCGVSSDADMIYAVVYKIGDKRALLDRELRRAKGGPQPDSECAAPRWERDPARVTFLPAGMQATTFAVTGRVVDPYMPEPPVQQSPNPPGSDSPR
jgi:hypothetical protein